MCRLSFLLFLIVIFAVIVAGARPKDGKRGQARKRFYHGRRVGEWRKRENDNFKLHKNGSSDVPVNNSTDVLDPLEGNGNTTIPEIKRSHLRRDHRRKSTNGRRRNNKSIKKHRRYNLKRISDDTTENKKDILGHGRHRFNRNKGTGRRKGHRQNKRQKNHRLHKKGECFCLSEDKLQKLQELLRREGLESEFDNIMSSNVSSAKHNEDNDEDDNNNDDETDLTDNVDTIDGDDDDDNDDDDNNNYDDSSDGDDKGDDDNDADGIDKNDELLL